MTKNKTATINPRSSGLFDKDTYTKTTTEKSLIVEADELMRCDSLSLNTDHVLSIKLVSFDETTNSLTTRFVSGEDLFLSAWNPTSFLGRMRNKETMALSRISELGAWLAKYHASELYSDKAESTADWLTTSFIKKLKYVRDYNLLSKETVNKIEQQFVLEIQKIKSDEYCKMNGVQFSRVHGDFVIYNMLLDKSNNVHILDFADTRIASSIEDIARFYQNILAISDTSSYRSQLFTKVLNDFLQAYGLPPETVESQYFKAIMCYNAIIHLTGGHYMRNMISFSSKMALNKITKAGLQWVQKELR